MNDFTVLLVGAIIGFIAGICAMGYSSDIDTALKLSNVMNASMLDCVTNKVITKEQVHDIETVFHRHIEKNFKHIKASHDDSCKEQQKSKVVIYSNDLRSSLTHMVYEMIRL